MNEEPELPPERRRARLARGIAIGALLLLGLALFRTQVWEPGRDGRRATRSHLRAVPLAAARGEILDRDSVVLAASVPEYAVFLLPGPRDALRETLAELAGLLDLGDARLARLEETVSGPARPIVVARGVSFDAASRVEENRSRLPRVVVELWPTRRYPDGAAVAAVTGRLAPAPLQGSTGEDAAGARAAQRVGVSGLELAHEQRLGGEPGLRWVRVAPDGTVLGDAREREAIAPTPGAGIRTTIAHDLQLYVARTLEAAGAGAAVVLDVESGGVLALHSSPVRDLLPKEDSARAEQSRTPGDERVMNDAHRAVAVRRAPGALFHPLMAVVGLDAGIQVDQEMTVPCRGGMRYGNRYFRCWNANGHGRLAMTPAIAEGCDVYFYQAGLKVGLEALLAAGTRLGLSASTGVGLPEERPGLFPRSISWLREHTGWPAAPASALELGAGRGLNQQTLIGVARWFSMLAEDGSKRAPGLLLDEPRDAQWQLPLTTEQLAPVRAGLEQAVAPGGAASAARTGAWRVRGQVARWRTGVSRGTSVFAGTFGAPSGPDEIVVAVAVTRTRREDEAAAIAGAIADYYLRRRHEKPATGGLAVRR